jgi:hypothetical protein
MICQLIINIIHDIEFTTRSIDNVDDDDVDDNDDRCDDDAN